MFENNEPSRVDDAILILLLIEYCFKNDKHFCSRYFHECTQFSHFLLNRQTISIMRILNHLQILTK